MHRFDHLILICQKERNADSPKGCCHSKGSADLLDRMKALTKEHGLKGKIRVTAAGCLDYCKKGITAVAFSKDGPAAETWYTGLVAEDADTLFTEHILEKRIYSAKQHEIRRK